MSALRHAAAAALALLLGAFAATRAVERVPPPTGVRLPLMPWLIESTASANGTLAGRPPFGPPGALPVAAWTARFRALEERGAWEELDALLDDLATRAPALYRRSRLGYLHARADLATGEDASAVAHLEPFLAAGDPLRPLALHHLAALAEAAGDPRQAALRRGQLLRQHPGSLYWHDDLVEQLAGLEQRGSPTATLAFVAAMQPLASDPRSQRELLAARVDALLAAGAADAAGHEGAALLAQSTADDSAERVALLLDRPDVLRRLPATALRDLGDSMLHHRRWQRAEDFYLLARRALPEAAAELDFAIGRAHFFAEDYGQAERLYRRAALHAHQGSDRARALFHAARAAQLGGDDEGCERLLGEAIAVPGRSEGAVAALTARIRLDVHRHRRTAARADLALLRLRAGGNRAVVEGAVLVAMGELAAGNDTAAAATLSRMPRSLDPFDRAELTYWRARSAESRHPAAALAAYLEVLRAEVPSHFAYLARHRLAEPPLAAAAAARVAALRREVERALRAHDLDRARRLATDAVLLGGDDDLATLAAIYRNLPAYAAVLEARPLPLPSFPLDDADTDEQLAAMGLFDEVVGSAGTRYPLTPFDSGLTRSVVYRLGGASRASIQAVESLMAQVPDDYVPQLLPRQLRELLYPRYFYDWIAADAATNHADPRLLLAIMREESRFNPRAKSAAAARGLMQLLLTTARQVGEGLGLVEVAPEDLYDPRLVIRLGAKYLGDLLARFDGDPYAAAAAYNAGPTQARLWLRLAPAPGHDYFLSSVSFIETRAYVRKVLNSVERYGEIYQGAPPTGGVRAEP